MQENVAARIRELVKEYDKLKAGQGSLISQGRDIGSLGAGIGGLAGQVSSLAGEFMSLYVAAKLAKEIIEAMIAFMKEGFKFRAEMESARLGIGSIIAATQELVDADGRRLEGSEKLNASLGLAKGIMRQIQIAGLETTATTTQLVRGFQALLGPASAVGFSLDQTQKFVLAMVQSMGALGIEFNQISAEGRSLLDGSIVPTQDRLAVALGITGEMVKKWKEQGVLFDMLLKKMEAFKLAGSEVANTWSGVSSNMKDAFAFFSGEASGGLFEGVKQSVKEIMALLVDAKNARIADDVAAIHTAIKGVEDDLGRGILAITRDIVGHVKEINTWLANNSTEVAGWWDALKGVGLVALELLKQIGLILEDIFKLGVETRVWETALRVVKGVLATIAEAVGVVRLAFLGFKDLIANVLVRPLAWVLDALATLGETKAGGMMNVTPENVAALREMSAGIKKFADGQHQALVEGAEGWAKTGFPVFNKVFKEGTKEAAQAVEQQTASVDSGRQALQGLMKDLGEYNKQGKDFKKFQDNQQFSGITKQFEAQKQLLDAEVARLEAMPKTEANAKQLNDTLTKRYNLEFAYGAAVKVNQENQEKGNKKQADHTEKANSAMRTYIDSIKDAALVEAHALAGDRYGEDMAKAFKQADHELNQLTNKLTEFKGSGKEGFEREAKWWIDYRLGIALARAELARWKEDMRFWSDNLQRIGELKGDPSMVKSAGIIRLDEDIAERSKRVDNEAASRAQAIWDDAVRSSQRAGADVEAIWAGVNDRWLENDHKRAEMQRTIQERSTLERQELEYRAYGDASKLMDGYFESKRTKLDNEILSLRGVITNETALRTYASRKYSELAKQELEAKMDAQDSFLGYLGNYLSLEFGLYKDHTTRTREMWRDMAASSVGFLRQLGQELQTGLSEYITALFTNDSKKRESAWRDMLQRMLNDAMRWATDVLMLWAKQQWVLPVVASIVGVDDSGLGELGLNISGGQGKKSGLGMGDVAKYGGYAKDGYSMFKGGGSWASSFDKFGYETLGIGTLGYSDAALSAGSSAFSSSMANSGLNGVQALKAADSAAVSAMGSPTVSGGLGSGLSAAGAGAGVGGLAGQIMRPDTYTPSLVGAGAGAAAGATAAMVPALGMTSFAGPVGMAVGLVAAAITSLATPETKKSSWATPQASEPAVWIVDGQPVAASYGVIRTTKSGMFGSQSTEHKAIYDLANPQITAEVTAGMEAATAGLKSFSKSLGQSEAEFKETMKGANSMMIAIPEGYEEMVYRNLANLQAEHYLKQTGLVDQANALLRSGESYIDMINRTETAAATAAAALGVVGLSLEQMAGSAERMVQGDWASRVIEVMGGAQGFTDAMTRFNKWAYSGAEQAEHAMQYFGGKAITAIGEIQASGVNLQNFWGEYRSRMEAGLMSPEEFGQWARAATWVEQAYTAAANAAGQQVQAEQKHLQAMQATRQELVQQAVAWSKARDSLRAFLFSMRTDQYTTLSPTANLAERQAKYFEVRAKAQSGDLGSQDDFRQYAKDFREFAYDFYGANQDYVAIDQMIQSDTSGLISLADMQLQATTEQIARLDAQILLSQQILASGSLVNDNLGRVAGSRGSPCGGRRWKRTTT